MILKVTETFPLQCFAKGTPVKAQYAFSLTG